MFYHLFFMVTSYMSILQTDFILLPSFRYQIGDNFFYVLLSLISFNILIIFGKISYMAYKMYQKNRLKKNYEKLKEKL